MSSSSQVALEAFPISSLRPTDQIVVVGPCKSGKTSVVDALLRSMPFRLDLRAHDLQTFDKRLGMLEMGNGLAMLSLDKSDPFHVVIENNDNSSEWLRASAALDQRLSDSPQGTTIVVSDLRYLNEMQLRNITIFVFTGRCTKDQYARLCSSWSTDQTMLSWEQFSDLLTEHTSNHGALVLRGNQQFSLRCKR